MKTKFRDVIQLVLMSDTHELHREVSEVPNGTAVVFAGDFTMFSRSMQAVVDFNDWLGELPHPYKIVVPGNHEFFLDADPSKRSMLSNATVLINETIEIEGLRVWGSPVTLLSNGAFGVSSAADRRRLYAQIPKDTDILITHGPPYGIIDAVPGSGLHSGCRELFDMAISLRPRLHVFGHVHGAHGIFQTDDTVFVNAALFGQHGDLDRDPIVLQMRKK